MDRGTTIDDLAEGKLMHRDALLVVEDRPGSNLVGGIVVSL